MRVKEKESHFQLPNTIDGCGAYLVRASSSHTSTLATTTATNVKKAKQLTLHVPHFFFCVHFLKSMQDYNEKFSNPTFCMGRFFVYFTLKISCRNLSTIGRYTLGNKLQQHVAATRCSDKSLRVYRRIFVKIFVAATEFVAATSRTDSV